MNNEAHVTKPMMFAVIALVWVAFGVITGFAVLFSIGGAQPFAGLSSVLLPFEIWYILAVGELIMFVGNTVLAWKALRGQLRLLVYLGMSFLMILLMFVLTYLLHITTWGSIL